MPRDLVQPLEAAWQEVIDAVLTAPRRRAPSTREPEKLAPQLVELSHAYNAGLAGDADALAAAEAIAREAAARAAAHAPALSLRTRTERLTAGMKLAEADVVVLGQVLSELDVAMEPAERIAKHAALIADLLARVVA